MAKRNRGSIGLRGKGAQLSTSTKEFTIHIRDVLAFYDTDVEELIVLAHDKKTRTLRTFETKDDLFFDERQIYRTFKLRDKFIGSEEELETKLFGSPLGKVVENED